LGGRDFPHPSRQVMWSTQTLQGTLSLYLGQSGRGMMFTTHTYVAPRFKKE